MKKIYIFLLLEIILNIITGSFGAIAFIPLFIIAFDLLIRLFIKNDNLLKNFNKFVSSIFPVQPITIFKIIAIVPKVLVIISLIVFSGLFNYLFFTRIMATILFILNIVVNIFTLISCTRLYQYEKFEYIKAMQHKDIEKDDSAVILPKYNKDNGDNFKLNSLRVDFIKGWDYFWKNYFNFKDRTNLKLFLFGVLIYEIIHLIITEISVYLLTLYTNNIYVTIYIATINLLLIIITIPLITLNIRRLRDVGLSNIINYILNALYISFRAVPVLNVIYSIAFFIFLCMPTETFCKKKESNDN